MNYHRYRYRCVCACGCWCCVLCSTAETEMLTTRFTAAGINMIASKEGVPAAMDGEIDSMANKFL